MLFKCTKKVIIVVCLIVLFVVGSLFYFLNPTRIVRMIHQEDYDRAIKITTIGMKFLPNYSKWYSMRAYSEFKLENYEGSIKDYDKAYELEIDEYKMMFFDNKIYIRYYLKDYNKALEDFDNAIEKSNDDFEKDSFLWDKAQFLYNIGLYNDALKIYDSLIIKSDDDRIYLLKTRLYFERAQVYEKLGKSDLARKDLEVARNSQMGESFENPIPLPTILLDDEE